MWSRVKKVFKKKRKKRDEVITYDGEQIVLKDIGYPAHFERAEDIPHNMKVHTKYIGRAATQGKEFIQYQWEINGVIITAEDIISAQRKYLRTKDTK